MKHLDPKAVWLFFISSVAPTAPFVVFFAVLGVLTISGDNQSGTSASTIMVIMILVLILQVLIGYLWAKLTYRFYKYELRDDGFRKEHGIIWKRYVTIPYDRIQNVDIYRGLIARLLGLSDLQIQTAGGITSSSYGAFSEGRLPGLSREIAEQLRDEVIDRSRKSKDQGL